jgi:hypothetical protein
MRRATPLLLVIALAGCRSTETPETHRPRATAEPAQDAPTPGGATDDAPDFSDPKPPVAVTSKASKEVVSTRDRLLHNESR